MSMSLRDQLLQVGLISAKQAKEAERQQQHQQRQQAPKRKDQKSAERRVAPPVAGAGGSGGHARAHGAPARAIGAQGAGATAAPPAPVIRQSIPVQRADPALSAKVARDQALNRKQQEKAQKKALLDQIRVLIEQNRLPPIESADGYNFVDGDKIRRIPVDASARVRLTRGDIVIARHAGRYDLVPAAIASRIRERDEHAIITVAATPAAAALEEGYEGFAVPDDLMW